MFQILRADKAAWLHMADVVKDIRPSDGSRPLEAEFERLPTVHSVVFALMPLQQTGSKGFDSKGDKGGKGKLGKGWKGNRPSPYDTRQRDVVRTPWRQGQRQEQRKGKGQDPRKHVRRTPHAEAPAWSALQVSDFRQVDLLRAQPPGRLSKW